MPAPTPVVQARRKAAAASRRRRSRLAKRLDRPKRRLLQALRRPLIAYARSTPRRPRGEPDTVYILLASAYGMGGTIRAALNLAGYLAGHRPVEVISVYRYRQESFFGSFPPGVKVTALDDRRRGVVARGLGARLRELLRARRSILIHNADRRVHEFNLWTDIQLVRKLRGLRGTLITTRPGLNLLAAELAIPGLVTIGQEQMHLRNHPKPLRRAMPALYPRLDAMAVLTDRDARNYRKLVGDGLRLVKIPNSVREMPGSKADLSAKTVLAAGRFAYQKGFDLLLPAWAQVARDHPDWRLRLCGSGAMRRPLRTQIKDLGLDDAVSFEGPADMAEAMAQASIFALSSRFEGFPLILLEAMSKGMAVVSFDCPTGPAEIIDDHRNGILVPPHDVDAFAAGLRELIEDEELRRACAAAAVPTAERYKMAAVGPMWDALLADLARAPRANGGPPAAPARQDPATGPDVVPAGEAGEVGAPVR